ncbi:TPR domain [Pyrenophora seminiperda CCB06]|uniref:TPR domain n=1 Tax=Pyrenophora seminiperda CCB06 TaxID=1302712 RepID=A0A3M7M4A8_9PLEO|nr:TPR domain [Pyrenophora seminiperda CCB06]
MRRSISIAFVSYLATQHYPNITRTTGYSNIHSFLRFIVSTMKQSNEIRIEPASIVAGPYLPCTTSVDNLEPLSIRQLSTFSHHLGNYLILRTIEPLKDIPGSTGISVMVEDQDGDNTRLQLCRQRGENSCAATDLVGKDSILIIKEPHFASEDFGLRVDHLSDVMFLNKGHPKVPLSWQPQPSEKAKSAHTLRLEGNILIGLKWWWKAIQVYSSAIARSSTLSEIEMIKRNRSLAYLNTQQYDAALLDTGFPHFGKDPSYNALIRAAQALYQLARFEQCREVAERLYEEFPNDDDALTTFNRVLDRCIESRSGTFDFKLLQLEAKKRTPPQLDHATYMGPIEVRETELSGRGLFATKPMKVGDLILCEKAYASAYYKKTEGFFEDPRRSLKVSVTQKLYTNPSTASDFFSLYHGDAKAMDVLFVDGKPVIDTFLVNRIIDMNAFPCPVSTLNIQRDYIADNLPDPTAFNSRGLWIKASYFNHNCLSNVAQSYIGDMVIMRAARDLDAGTELTIAYAVPHEQADMKMLFEKWDFICSCARCSDIKNTEASVIAERQRLDALLKDLISSAPSTHDYAIRIKKVEGLLRDFNNTYRLPAGDVPRLSLIQQVHLYLIRVHMGRGEFKKTLECVGNLLTSLGFTFYGLDDTSEDFKITRWGMIPHSLMEGFHNAREAFAGLKLEKKSQQAKHYAKLAYLLIVGEDTSFEKSYSFTVS